MRMCGPKCEFREEVLAYMFWQHAHLCLYLYCCVNYMLSILSETTTKQNQGNFFLPKGCTGTGAGQQAHQGRKLVFSLAQTVTLSHTPTPPQLARVQHHRLLFCFKVYFYLFVCLNVGHICTGTLGNQKRVSEPLEQQLQKLL